MTPNRPVAGMLLAAALCCAFAPALRADNGLRAVTTPQGLWRTFDDRTGLERGRVQIQDHGGVLTGRVVGTVDPAEGARPCVLCGGARKDKPIIGLTIITGMRQDGARWDGGEILDPQTGSVYDCTMRLADGGEKLIVRGFLGIALLGRSQTWVRAR